MRGYATLRADGEWVRVGANCYFGERATVHIADAHAVRQYRQRRHRRPLRAGARVHVEDRVVVGDAALVMDDATSVPDR